MRVAQTEIPGVLVIVPDVLTDGRGFFVETYHAERYRQCGIDGPFVQDNHTRSVSGTIRGLHLQRRRMQGKLIRVIEGEVHVQPNAERFVARVLAVNGAVATAGSPTTSTESTRTGIRQARHVPQ